MGEDVLGLEQESAENRLKPKRSPQTHGQLYRT